MGVTRNLERVVFGVGAVLLIGGLLGYILAIGVPRLWPPDRRATAGPNVVAVDLPQQRGAALVWMYSSNPVRPFDSGRVGLRFYLSSTNPQGATFVFGGPIASDMFCYGSSIEESRPAYTELSESQRSLVDEFVIAMPSHGLVSDSELGSEISRKQASTTASKLPYYVVAINDYRDDDDKEFNASGKPPWHPHSHLGDFSCSVSWNALRERRASINTITLPGLMARATLRSRRSAVYLQRRFDFQRSSSYEMTSSTVTPDYNDATRVTLDDIWQELDNNETDRIALNRAIATFERSGARGSRERTFFWTGVAAATVATLTIALLKMFGDLIAGGVARILGMKR